MARTKRTSPALAAAKARATALKTVDPTMDFGKGVSLAALTAANAALEAKLNKYNETLSDLDDQLNGVEQDEGAVTDLAARLLGGVKISYGPDSSEYEKSGGTRKSEYKRATRKPGKPPQ